MQGTHNTDLSTADQDAQELLDQIAKGTAQAGGDWEVGRFVGAAAEAAATVLAILETQTTPIIGVFTGSGPTADWDSFEEYPE